MMIPIYTMGVQYHRKNIDFKETNKIEEIYLYEMRDNMV